MPLVNDVFELSETIQKSLHSNIRSFCTTPDYQHTLLMMQEFKASLYAFSSANQNIQQAQGWWVACFLQELITHLPELQAREINPDCNFLSFVMHFPFQEESLFYKPVLQLIRPEAVRPLTPEQFLFNVQTATLLIDLASEHNNVYLEKLKVFLGQNPNCFSIYVRMLVARNYHINRLYLDEQFNWVELICLAWSCLDYDSVVYFILQWIYALDWLRPSLKRKTLLLELEKVYHLEDTLNQAGIYYELFNIHDKSITSAEKLFYMSLLRNLSQSLLTVEQLQAIYYFSGNIKSAVDSSFKESVSDYQYSNYYTYKRWEKIRHITHFLRSYLSAEEFSLIQAKVELKTIELINQINIQSNVFVETLQANFLKIEQLYKQVEELSLTDTLTGIRNRRYLQHNINELLLLAKRHKTPLSFSMMDIDHFKLVNDTYGHLVGDYVLQEIALILKDFFRKSDFIIRYGGEEFLVVLFDSSCEQTQSKMEELRMSIENHRFVYNRIEIPITISIGYVCVIFSRDEEEYTLDNLISAADVALYESKHLGRNRTTGKTID